MTRDTSQDGLNNKIETALLTGLRPLWTVVNAQPWLHGLLNRIVVNRAVNKLPARPLALSTLHDEYTSWPSLTDHTWFSRYLPAADMPVQPDVAELFRPRPSGPRLSDRSTLLFPSFAQWFTDGFLMTEPNRRKTRTNHQIDLSQLYGISDDVTRALRLSSAMSGERGRLRSVVIDGEEWAPPLYDDAGQRAAGLAEPTNLSPEWDARKRATLFAFGGERANSTCYTAAVNTLFLREHNRLAAAIETANPAWDDDRVFETARNVNIVQLIRVVVEEYINHISPYWLQLSASPVPAYRALWNRPNWIPVEFNLLYRWHSLIPEEVVWSDQNVPITDCQFDNSRLLATGLGGTFESATETQAWSLGLFNTAAALQQVELASIKQGRTNKLGSYNDYRVNAGFPRVTRFEQISGDPMTVEALRRLYTDVDRIEFFVGLLAEDLPPRSAVPPLIGRMVAADAFSHALTNPLLSPLVYTERTFSRVGLAAIESMHSLADLLARNTPAGPRAHRVTMEWGDYRSSA